MSEPLPLAGLRVVEVAHWVAVPAAGALLVSVPRSSRSSLRRAMGYFHEIEHASGSIETVGPPFRIDGVALGAREAASPINRDAEAILAEAGLAEDEIRALLPAASGS